MIRSDKLDMSDLTLETLKTVVGDFVKEIGTAPISELYGITDDEAVSGYVEQSFHHWLRSRFTYAQGGSASGMNFPQLGVELKVTSIRRPQSICPFRDASQKVYGLGYHLLILIHEKNDDPATRAAYLYFPHAIFVSRERTADYQTTRGLLEILGRDGNTEDVISFLEERNLPLDEIGRQRLAEKILSERPELGYLTVSVAWQWRLQYSRVIKTALTEEVLGIEKLHE